MSYGILASGIRELARDFEPGLDMVVVGHYTQHTERLPKDFKGILGWRCRSPGSTAVIFEFGCVRVLCTHTINAVRPKGERIQKDRFETFIFM